jgi:hypothetical protein
VAVSGEDEIAAWLRGQAEADIRAAAAATSGPWEFEGDDPTDDELFTVCEDGPAARFGDTVAWVRGGNRNVANGQHMERHDPLTETARAESVLAVLGAYETAWSLAEKSWDREESDQPLYDQARALRRAVRLLAYGYRYRDGYKEEWAA